MESPLRLIALNPLDLHVGPAPVLADCLGAAGRFLANHHLLDYAGALLDDAATAEAAAARQPG